MLLLFLMINSYLMIIMKHPLTCGLILMIQTILTALIIGKINLNFWYSYIIFLIMIGGMLILFIYMTSIASNEKFNNKNFPNWLIPLSLILMELDFYFNELTWQIPNIMKNMNFKINLIKYINWPFNLTMILMIIYLFITLMATVKITKTSYGALRQKF
uniref:NADH-ubiquinone oxidoreductase chain 6 n=1 Tax=Batophila aerata TaxID=877817 RepID=A0A3G1GRH5_9CUCU|nr:NADH dehydrogenase subunit 6 [Batophila aerata]